jgi:hypothetical protein
MRQEVSDEADRRERSRLDRYSYMTIVAIIASFIVVGIGVQAYLYQQAEQDDARTACLNANEARQANLSLWTYILDLSGDRVVGDYPDTPALGRAAAFLLLLTLLFGAVGQYQLHTWNTPLTAVSYPILGHRVACLILAIYWPRWIHTTKTPFRKYSDEDLRPKGLST